MLALEGSSRTMTFSRFRCPETGHAMLLAFHPISDTPAGAVCVHASLFTNRVAYKPLHQVWTLASETMQTLACTLAGMRKLPYIVGAATNEEQQRWQGGAKCSRDPTQMPGASKASQHR